MATSRRTLFIVLGSIVALILVIVLAIPLFLNADSFRTRIESTMSTALGRKVTLGKLDLSVLSGSLVAESSSVADDPAFSGQPFLQTGPVKINVEMLPLLFSHEIHVTGFTVDSPHIVLLRAPNGIWDYSSIGSAHKATHLRQRRDGPESNCRASQHYQRQVDRGRYSRSRCSHHGRANLRSADVRR